MDNEKKYDEDFNEPLDALDAGPPNVLLELPAPMRPEDSIIILERVISSYPGCSIAFQQAGYGYTRAVHNRSIYLTISSELNTNELMALVLYIRRHYDVYPLKVMIA